MIFLASLHKISFKKLVCLPIIISVIILNLRNINAETKQVYSVSDATIILSNQLRAKRFEKAILTARTLSVASIPIKYAASFSELLCLMFLGKSNNLGNDFQELARLIESLSRKNKKWIWNFIASSQISFPHYRIITKNKHYTDVCNTYLGIAVFLGNLNSISPVQESQKILFALLDSLENSQLIKNIKKHKTQKQIILSLIQRNQELLQIMTRHAPIEVGQAAM